jgi:hypothetical protein
MQSDDRITTVLSALRGPREAFDAAIVSAIDELGIFLAEQRVPAHEHVAQESVRLGNFAAGRIDVERFAAIVGRVTAVSPAALDRIAHVVDLLTAFRGQGDRLYRVRVLPGADVRDTVRDALAVRGRLFNAGRHVEQLRTGTDVPELEEVLCFSRWLKSERMLAPPLVVEVDGADLMADGLAEYLDGALKIVLIVSGLAPPAPLARLIAPHTFVMQCTDAAAVSYLAGFAGTGIAAVLPDGCARFRHDPSRGTRLSQRLEVELLPESVVRPSVGRYNPRRQAEDLAWLRELAQLSDLARAQQHIDATQNDDAAPADQLAGWLLRNADLDNAGTEAM